MHCDEAVPPCACLLFCSVVASALGIPALLPFLKAVCLSKKSWQARHTGIKIVQQIAILMGCAVLPHLKALVDIIKHGLQDENQKVMGVGRQDRGPCACVSIWTRLVVMSAATFAVCQHLKMSQCSMAHNRISHCFHQSNRGSPSCTGIIALFWTHTCLDDETQALSWSILLP